MAQSERIPIIYCDERRASDAYNAHIALLMAENSDPTLKDNPFWTVLRQDAFEAFSNAFRKVC